LHALLQFPKAQTACSPSFMAVSALYVSNVHGLLGPFCCMKGMFIGEHDAFHNQLKTENFRDTRFESDNQLRHKKGKPLTNFFARHAAAPVWRAVETLSLRRVASAVQHLLYNLHKSCSYPCAAPSTTISGRLKNGSFKITHSLWSRDSRLKSRYSLHQCGW